MAACVTETKSRVRYVTLLNWMDMTDVTCLQSNVRPPSRPRVCVVKCQKESVGPDRAIRRDHSRDGGDGYGYERLQGNGQKFPMCAER